MRTIVTFTFKHSTYYPIWENYYKQYFENLYVIKLADNIIDNSTYTIDKWNKLQADLFPKNEVVFFADIDEFVVPNPQKYKNLDDYINKNKGDVLRATGYNVIQTPSEQPLDFTRSILSQRSYWSRDNLYNKVVGIRKPLIYWNPHNTVSSINPDEDLFLLHTRDADLKTTIERFKKKGCTFNLDDFEERIKTATKIPDMFKLLL